MDSKEIIELKPESVEEGNIEYTHVKSVSTFQFSNFGVKLITTILGIAFFVLILSFFVTVILPLIAIFILWMVLRDLVHSLKR